MNKGFYLLFDLGVSQDDKTTSLKHFKAKLPNTDIIIQSIYLISDKLYSSSSKPDLTDGRFNPKILSKPKK